MIRDSKHSPVSCLPEDCVKICAGAHELFTALCNRIRRGEVTIEELHSINKRQEHVMNMCTAISKHTKDSEGELNFTSLKVSLDQRMAEFKALMCYLEQLGVFCRFIGVPITGTKVRQKMYVVVFYQYTLVNKSTFVISVLFLLPHSHGLWILL